MWLQLFVFCSSAAHSVLSVLSGHSSETQENTKQINCRR